MIPQHTSQALEMSLPVNKFCYLFTSYPVYQLATERIIHRWPKPVLKCLPITTGIPNMQWDKFLSCACFAPILHRYLSCWPPLYLIAFAHISYSGLEIMLASPITNLDDAMLARQLLY